MSRIVSLVSSPRVGANSETIMGAILDGAMGLSTNEIAFYRLDKMKATHGCRACKHCRESGRCVQDDEISDILADIRGSDVLIVSTPMYFGGCTSQLKQLIDRMYSFLDDERKPIIPAGKKAIVVVTYSSDADNAMRLADLLEQILVRTSFDVIGKVVYCDHGNPNAAAEDLAEMKEMRVLGAKLRNT